MIPFSSLNIVLKKLKKQTQSALFLIIPIALLLGTTSIISSQIKNYSAATDKAVFDTISNQSTILQIVKQNTQQGGGFGGDQGGAFRQDRAFTTDDLASIKSISNVTSSTVNYTLPINQIITKDLVKDKQVDLSQLTVASSDAASLYSKSNFEYVRDQPVPIILNANSMQEQVEEWNGQTVISVPAPQRVPGQAGGQTQNAFREKFPVKSKVITIDQKDLIDKEFNVSFGGLDPIAKYNNAFDGTNFTFTKLTDAEIASKESERSTSISKYWDYSKISTPVNFKFKVVGYIKSESNRAIYVPESFTEALMKTIITNQLESKNANAIPEAELGAVYRGINYNGVSFLTAQGQQRRIPGQPQGPRVGQAGTSITTQTAYTIPGLLIEQDGNTSEIKGTINDPDLFAKSSKTSQNLTVKFNSIFNREQVVRDLNSKGFAYTDTGNSQVFGNLKKTLDSLAYWSIVAFILLISVILAFNMSKTISEAKKEIGIFRAVGFSKGNILSIFTTQGLFYTFLGIVGGVILGFVGNYIISFLSLNLFKDFVSKTIKETYNITPEVSVNQFQSFDWSNLGIITGILALISLIISLIFSYRATKISPVEAIKS
jgi:ABC-type antimicrobial peptide transport system permease subunit